MDKYIGTYRVSCEFDRRNLEPIKDETFIVCSKGGEIYRVSNELLAYYRPSRGNSEQFSKKLIDKGIESVNNCSTDGDMLIYFSEKSLHLVVDEVGAITTGANIKPWSVKNLRKLRWFKENKQLYIDNGYYKELSEEEKEIFRERFKNNITIK